MPMIFFLFFKNYFWHQHIKTIQKIQTALNFSKKKLKFSEKQVESQSQTLPRLHHTLHPPLQKFLHHIIQLHHHNQYHPCSWFQQHHLIIHSMHHHHPRHLPPPSPPRVIPTTNTRTSFNCYNCCLCLTCWSILSCTPLSGSLLLHQVEKEENSFENWDPRVQWAYWSPRSHCSKSKCWENHSNEHWRACASVEEIKKNKKLIEGLHGVFGNAVPSNFNFDFY